MKPQEILDKIRTWQKIRENHEKYFWLSREAYNGNHFVFYDSVTKELYKLKNRDDHQIRKLPEVSKQVDKFVNFIIRTDYTFVVIPSLLQDEKSVRDAQFLSALARQYYERMLEDNISANMVKTAAFDNVSFLEVSVNDRNDDIVFRNWDAFDIIFDPALRWSEQKLVVKVFKKTLSDMEESNVYKVPEKVRKQGNTSFEKNLKEVWEEQQFGTEFNADKMKFFECFILDKNGLKIKTIDSAGNVYRDDNYPNIDVIPITPFQVYAGDYYQPSFAYRLIPINQDIDLINDRISDMILRLAKGGWLVQEEEEIDGELNDEVGQIIRYRSVPPTAVQMPQVPIFLRDWFVNTVGLMERYGLSPVVGGNMPISGSNVRANAMLETIIDEAYKSNYHTIVSYTNVLKKSLRTGFKFLYHLWKEPREGYDIELPAEYKDFARNFKGFVSEEVRSQYDDPGYVYIPNNFKKFKVELDTRLGYTLSAKQEAAMKLFEAGLISKETVQEIFKLGSTAYIMGKEEAKALKSPEMQGLLKQFPNLPPDKKKAVIEVIKLLGSQQQQQQLQSLLGDTANALEGNQAQK